MTTTIQPFDFLVVALAGWLNRRQQAVIDYLIEENRVRKEQVGGKQLRFTDEQRIQDALANFGHIIAPDTVKNSLKRHGIEPAPERRKHILLG